MNKAIKDEGLRLGKMKATLVANAAALRAMRNVPGVNWACCGIYDKQVDIRLSKEADERVSIRAAMKALRARKADKRFDEAKGQVVYTILAGDVEVIVTAGVPKRCEVEKVTEEVTIPSAYYPERKETRTRYKLVDPTCVEG